MKPPLPVLLDRESRIAEAASALLDALVPDWEADPDLCDTPARMARMYAQELCAGLATPRPALACFPKPDGMDQLISVGPITVHSLCPHHFAPILGRAWIGVVPGSKLLGLSKYARLVRWCMARPIIQEKATQMIADELVRALPDAPAIGVVVRAQHMCMSWRGVREPETVTTTSAMRGDFLNDATARAEFVRFASEGA